MKSQCLACGGVLGVDLFSIPDLPLVDSFCTTEDAARSVPVFSITVAQCSTCLTIQLVNPPDTSAIYKQYIYESRSSPDLKEHFAGYASFIKNLGVSKHDKILEIGANDGLLLSELVRCEFCNLTAIDPSPQTAAITLEEVSVINDFFSQRAMMGVPRGEFDLIIANNCFSHIPNLCDTLTLCRDLLSERGALIVEVQSTLDLLQDSAFDYIYHEHFFYHTVTSFETLAKLAGLELYDVLHVPTKGGSYRLLFGHPGRHEVAESVRYWLYRESVAGVHSVSPWVAMRRYLDTLSLSINHHLHRDNVVAAAYGASATGTVFLRYMNLEGAVQFIVDDNPKRQNLYSPRAAIPVRDPATLNDSNVCLVLAWRHLGRIAPKLQALNVPFVTPLPIFRAYG